MKKIFLTTIAFMVLFSGTACALDLNSRPGLGFKVQGWVPMATFKIFFDTKNALEIEGGYSTLGWAIQGYYVNHFMKVGSALPYFTVGGGVNSGAFAIIGGVGVEYFMNNNLGVFVADKATIIIAPNVLAFMGGVESGLRFYF